MKLLLKRKSVKIIFAALATILVAVIVLLICVTGKDEKAQLRNEYDLKLSYDEQTQILRGKEKIDYANNSDNMFEKLYFHLYPNAFRDGAKASVISSANFDKAYYKGASYGNIEIIKVYNTNSDLSYEIVGEDENILSISLKSPLYPNETAEICIDFEVKLADINHRLGRGENTINFGNFYPIACVYEEGVGFKQDLYHSNGDPFYSDTSSYKVEIDFNSSFSIASTGNLIKSNQNNSRIINFYEGKLVRDFAFVLSENFERISNKAGGIEVNYYGYKGDANMEECLNVSAEALQFFSDLIGKYPYKQLSVVKSSFIHGGMEYPNIVLISDNVTQTDLNYVIVHEIAHQWWYGVVGNDEYNNAWIDEGLAEYCTLLFFEENKEYGEDFSDMIKNAHNTYIHFEDVFKRTTGKVDGRMQRSLNEFETEPEYTNCIYTKGVIMFNSLRELMGKSKFEKSLKKTFEVYKYKNITPAQLIAIFARFGGKETESLFNNYLQGKIILLKN